jgi:sodium/bile acid cotransporter 7
MSFTPAWIRRFGIDPYLVLIITMVGLATVLPCRGAVAVGFNYAVVLAIGLLFFLYGARLSRAAVLAGLADWRLQGTILLSSFVVFPLLGLAARVLVPSVLTPDLYLGVLFLCLLPSTVQSSIAFTSIARGNVAAAVCAASASSLVGVVVTPLLAGLLMATHGAGISFHAVRDVALQLLAPFLAGQALSGRLSGWLARHRPLTGVVDRGSILLIVYTAFSAGVVNGIWTRLDPGSLAALLAVNLALLAVVLTATTLASRALGFAREDEIAIVFCGSKKSLASGIPMINVLFSTQMAGLIVIPLMLFHQVQLMVCAVLARRYAARSERRAPVDAPRRVA